SFPPRSRWLWKARSFSRRDAMRLRIVAAFALLVSGVAGCLPAVAQTCPLPSVALALNQLVAAPTGFDQVAFFDVKSGAAVGSPGALSGTPPSFTVNSLVLAQAQAFKDPATHTDNQVQLRWGKAADASAACLQPFTVSSPPPTPAAGGTTTPAARTTGTGAAAVNVQDCQSQGLQLRTTIRKQRGLGSNASDDFSLIVFCRDVTAFQIDRDYDVGTLLSPHAEIPSCSIEPAGPRIFQSETSLSTTTGGLQSTQPFTVQVLLQRACYDASVEVDLKAQRTDQTTQKLADVSRSYVLGQAV